MSRFLFLNFRNNLLFPYSSDHRFTFFLLLVSSHVDFDVGLISKEIFHDVQVIIGGNRDLISFLISVADVDSGSIEAEFSLDKFEDGGVVESFVVEFDDIAILEY